MATGLICPFPVVSAHSLLPRCSGLELSRRLDDGPAGSCSEGSDDEVEDVVFSTRRPRDAIAGASSGLKTVGRSLVIGSSTLLHSTMEGARLAGPAGGLRGFGEGLAGALLVSAGGVVVGATQCARGIFNTPEALLESLRGKQWSQRQRQWCNMAYSLPGEVQRLQAKALNAKASARSQCGGHGDEAASAVAARRHDGPSYYELLRVQASASGTELRRAYYRESRRCHPDKVGGDAAAVARFQQLSEAYKVLRDPGLRRAYDTGGHDAVAQMSTTVDLGALFSTVMHAPQWEPYIGEFALSRIMASDSAQRSNIAVIDCLASLCYVGEIALDLTQRQREVCCANALAARLQRMSTLCGAGGSAATLVEEEARQLVELPFAPGLLCAIAAVYESEATRFIGAMGLLDLRHELAQLGSQGRLLAQQGQTALATFRAVVALRRMVNEAQEAPAKCSGQPAGATTLCLEKPTVQAQLPVLATALWHVTVLDLEGTLRRVCRRVLRDSSVSFPTRLQRAEALLCVAQTFQRVASAHYGDATSGTPGEDGDLLRAQIREAAAWLAGGRHGEGPQGPGGAAASFGGL